MVSEQIANLSVRKGLGGSNPLASALAAARDGPGPVLKAGAPLG